jgi:hypothetical protein
MTAHIVAFMLGAFACACIGFVACSLSAIAREDRS